MNKFLKFALITLVSLVLIVLIGGYIVLKNIDLSQYKGMIEQKVAEATGRVLKIGNIEIKPSFNPKVRIENVAFSNAEWSKNPQMAEVGFIDVGIAVIPLIHGHYVINKFIINDAVVNLEENVDGVANWVFETPAQEEPKPEKTSYKFSLIKEAHAEETVAAQDASSADILSKIVIKEVAFNNVKINYTDKKAQTISYDIKNLTLDERDDKNIDFKFNVNDGLYSGQGMVGALKKLKSHDGFPVKGEFNVMGIGVATDAMLYDVLGELRFMADVKAKGFLGKDSTYNESADVSVKGDLKKIDAVINGVSIADNVIKGTTSVLLSGKVPSIKANLSSDKIDIASFANEQKTAYSFSLIKEAQATTMVPADKIPYEALYSVNADADVTIAKVVNKSALLAENLVLNAKVDNGVALFNIVSGKLAQGDIKANAKLNAGTKSLNLTADMVKVNLIELLKVLEAQSDSFNFINGGNTDLYVNLNGSGNTYAAIAESLDGRLVLIVDKSKLHLGNIGMIKGNVISQLFNTLKITKGNDDLKLACAVVRADFKNGLVKFPSGIVVNADKFTIVSNGDINLKNDKIDLGVKPFGGKLSDTNIAKALSSLVKLTGTLQKPSVGVDTANVVKNVVGATMTGPVYLGAQLVMENDDSPCHTALKGTGYETRFPESSNIAKSTTDDVGKVLDDSVGMVKEQAKGLLNMFSGKKN